MQTETTIEIAAPLERIVPLAVEVERWPEILPHYRWVKLLEGGGDRKVVEMAARRGRIPVRWRAVQEIDQDGVSPVIAYRHIWGVTRGMEVAWTFEERRGGVHVVIGHRFRPPWPVVGEVIAGQVIGPQFVEFIAGRTLRAIKAIAEWEAGVAEELR
jgi:hypothetical protein